MYKKRCVAMLAVLPCLASAEHLALDPIHVIAEKEQHHADLKHLNAAGDSAKLISQELGINLFSGGGVSSIPVMQGLSADRVRIKVDGMDLISSCANNMNPPLSFIDPAAVGKIESITGISPVRAGGDHIAGVIQVESTPPNFAIGDTTKLSTRVNSFYKSNNDARGVNLQTTFATESFSARYTGSYVEANNMVAGGNFKPAGKAAIDQGYLAADEIGSTAYQSENHKLGFAYQHDNQLIDFTVGVQSIPQQGFVNQRMDMTDNNSRQLSLKNIGRYDWGKLTLNVYHEALRHQMNFGDDKQFLYGAGLNVPGMPMDTKSRTLGLLVKADIDVNAHDRFTLGSEIQRYRLDDYWPAASPNSMIMWPNTFLNIHDGKRNRNALFAEYEHQWHDQLTGLAGIRYEQVKSSVDEVQGYNVAQYGAAATAFNNSDRSKTDGNWNATLQMIMLPDAQTQYAFGYAMKTRSPNLYERYTWASGLSGVPLINHATTMAMNMNNWFGDGNGYVGNQNLKPETAHTISFTGDWHDDAQTQWQLKVVPYITYVHDYIDAVACAEIGKACPIRYLSPANQTQTDGFSNLSLDNQSARIYGLDAVGSYLLASGTNWGSFNINGRLNYTRGKNTSTGDDLYNIMPLNTTLTLEQKVGAWQNAIQFKIVDAKDKVQEVRNEIATSGFSLMNLYASYHWKAARIDFAIENVFDRYYDNPLGGVYLGQGQTMHQAIPYGLAVPGMGRSINVGVTFNL
jgi:iron complex outermembrane receptor protein